jgi:hypothetical protein
VAGWIKSPGHCANLMNPAFTEMGAAFAVNNRSEFGVYSAQAFGTPRRGVLLFRCPQNTSTPAKACRRD